MSSNHTVSHSLFQPDIIKAFTSEGQILALTELFLGKSEDQVNILLEISSYFTLHQITYNHVHAA